MDVCLQSGHSARNLGRPILTINLRSCDLRPCSFSSHPKFLCPCVAKISLCVRVNHLSYRMHMLL